MKKKEVAVICLLVMLFSVLFAGCAKEEPTNRQSAVGIIGAMDVEVASLKEAANVTKTTTIAGMEFCEGRIGDKNVVIVKCGMGKVNAGICAHTLIHDFGCEAIINTGVAGSLDGEIDIGDIVVSTDAVQHDYDVEAIGFQKGEIPYTGLYAFPADETLRAAAVDAVKNAAPDVHVFEGRVCSGDQFISTKEQKDKIISDFGGMCCEMEGAAIAQVCFLNNTPFVVIRAISGKPDETEFVDYKVFEAQAAARCAQIVQYMVKEWDTDKEPMADPTEQTPEAFTVSVKEVSKHGNLILDTTFEEMNAAGIAIGDVITVILGEKEYDLPVGTAYTDVDSGEMLCRFDLEDNEVALGINYGSFAEETGAAEKQTIEEDPGYQWDIRIPEVKLALKEKQGYLDEYNARNLTRTDDRADYADLTDEEFANFRAVAVTGMKENMLYRSSTPIEPSIGRNEYAMAAMEQAGIKTVINLDDSAETMQGYDTYPGSYYSRCAVVNPEMGYDFESEAFAEKIKESVLFIIENDGPYLIHCKEGKDRTGILCAVLECFAGAPAEDVKRDYMITYRNYYGVEPADTAYGIILNNNLVKTLCGLFGTENLEDADLKEAAARYLTGTGLTEKQLAILRGKIAADTE